MNEQIVNFTCRGDERGSLIALEAFNEIPFEVKRVYYIFGTKNGVSRGFHAHIKLKQLAICVSGSCRFVLESSKGKSEFVLDAPTKGLLIDGLIWREMHDFTADCVLMVLASDVYNETDYIRDYQAFKELIKREA